jgi:hypothetical protein
MDFSRMALMLWTDPWVSLNVTFLRDQASHTTLLYVISRDVEIGSIADGIRSTNLGRTGTILTAVANTQTAYEDNSSFMIQ